MIDSFKGEHEFLSNFYECKVVHGGLTFKSSEAAFQAAKCADIADRIKFVDMTPGQAKRAGRKVKLRSDWESVKISIMHEILHAKFVTNASLANRLLKTGTATLVEGNSWNDTFWGVCNGNGLNNLGKILMIVRDELNLLLTIDEDEQDEQEQEALHHMQWFCDTFTEWAKVLSKEDEKFASAWGLIYSSLMKSSLARRLFYGGESVRTRKCPYHNGRWSGILYKNKPDGCTCIEGESGEATGWAPNLDDSLAIEPKISDHDT